MRMSSIFGGIFAAFFLLLTPSAALAQKAEVLVMNQQEVLAKSKAGQSISAQIQALAQTAQGEMDGEATKLQNEGQALDASKESMSKEDLQKRAQALMAKQQGLQRLGQIRQAELQQAEAAALAKLSEELEPVVRDIMKKRRANMVLRRVDVAVMDDAVDVTEDVIQALDKRVTTVQVVKPDLVAQARAQAAAQQQAQ